MTAEFLPCGDTALCVQFGEIIDRKLCLQVVQLKERVESAAIPGVIEAVPTYRSLLVHYDPQRISQQKLCEHLTGFVENEVVAKLQPKRWQMPVCFAEEFAWDLPELADSLQFSTEELVKKVCQTELFVYMIGFTMGLLYLGDFSEFKPVSRRTNPRTRLAAGSVAVAQGMAVIYPVVSPGGWNVIGNTPAPLFDIRKTPPSPFTPGDTICFYEVEKKEHERISEAASAGTYQLRWEEA